MILGIETHVCVLQTTLDLIDKGFEVHVLVDGVSSQRLHDRAIGIHRLAQAGACLRPSSSPAASNYIVLCIISLYRWNGPSGALLTTSEMVLFQMMRDAQHPHFKAISALVRICFGEGVQTTFLRSSPFVGQRATRGAYPLHVQPVT